MAGIASPKVSVYITNFNYGRFIDQAIKSVLSQTFDALELLVIDDGSSDNSREIIDEYASHSKVTVVYQENRGLTASNNVALRLARGAYIMRLDADDYLDENAISIMARVLDGNPDVGMVFPDYFVVDEAGEIIEVFRRHDFSEVTVLDQPSHGACTLIRKECLSELGGYDSRLTCQDGYDLWLRFVQRFGVRNVNLPLFFYRRHGSSLTTDENRILSTRCEIFKKHAEINEQPISTIGVVPVRGHSIDSRSSPLRELSGKALIDWTLDAALAASRLSTLVVTSPDDEVLDHVQRRYGSKVIALRRNVALARINYPLTETISHVLEVYSATHPMPDAVALLLVEAPFRTSMYIDNAVNALELFHTDVVVAVRPESDTFYRHNGDGLVNIRKAPGLRLEQEELFRLSGQLSVFRRSHLEESGRIHSGRIGHIVVDQIAGMVLHTELDWEIAELLAKNRQLVPE